MCDAAPVITLDTKGSSELPQSAILSEPGHTRWLGRAVLLWLHRENERTLLDSAPAVSPLGRFSCVSFCYNKTMLIRIGLLSSVSPSSEWPNPRTVVETLRFVASWPEVRVILGLPNLWPVSEVRAVLWGLFYQSIQWAKLTADSAEAVTWGAICKPGESEHDVVVS